MSLSFVTRLRTVSTTFFGVLVASAVCYVVSTAQNDVVNVRWENLKDRYGSFHEIEPNVVNEGRNPVFFDANSTPHMAFEWFDTVSNSWRLTFPWRCGTGYEPRPEKIKPEGRLVLKTSTVEWNENTDKDSIGVPKFRLLSEYRGIGRYRFRFSFGTSKSDLQAFSSYSPEFIVDENNTSSK